MTPLLLHAAMSRSKRALRALQKKGAAEKVTQRSEINHIQLNSAAHSTRWKEGDCIFVTHLDVLIIGRGERERERKSQLFLHLDVYLTYIIPLSFNTSSSIVWTTILSSEYELATYRNTSKCFPPSLIFTMSSSVQKTEI